jgi:hypothetical protein
VSIVFAPNFLCVAFEVLTSVAMKNTVILDVRPCRLVDIYMFRRNLAPRHSMIYFLLTCFFYLHVEIAVSNQQKIIKENYYIYCSPIIQSLKLLSNIGLLVFSRTSWN